MPRYTVLLVIFILVAIWDSYCLQEDYYWRDYTGTIPVDAVVGGQDVNGKNIYIGQAFVRKEGQIVSQISEGVQEVQAPIRGVKKVDSNIKILCGPQQNFYWAPGNSTHLHLQLIGKHAVRGGCEAYNDRDGLLNVGRVSHEGELKIGKVTVYSPENAHFYFSHKDYYWRDYTGRIPVDAVVGGQDVNGKNIYIGQAFVRKEGQIVSQITEGVQEVEAPVRGVKKVDSNIKILCGPQQNFYWAPGNSTHLHLQLIGKHAVRGGCEAYNDRDGLLNVGRVSHEGELKIGKVTVYIPENADFYFSHKGKELHTQSYEILLYDTNDLNVRIKPNTE